MAFVDTIRQTEHALADRIDALRATWRKRREQKIVYRRTLYELEQLTDRDLADLGLHKSEIADVAHEAAYGR